MEVACISKSTLFFLESLKENNNKEWFERHKAEYKHHQDLIKRFFKQVMLTLRTHDEITDLKVFRIY